MEAILVFYVVFMAACTSAQNDSPLPKKITTGKLLTTVPGKQAENSNIVYAVPGNLVTISCNASIELNLNETTTFTLQIFKNSQSMRNVLLTYLNIPPRKILLPLNGWKDRNITLYFQEYPLVYLPNTSVQDEATYVCCVNLESRYRAFVSRTKLKVL
ncbi:uncharacterized protein LOC129590703 [Paramacrobiotus metropolitanus]|uniref:uncharacterized protein LOC129590703 n=1 Tax=Paramacrobiotus metropolitanus TaxID=2943436 RepID=UPI00244632C6|nr:uncharacterized protein LOC129590703 [Paramacrobiotus metropolitanus]